MSTPEIHATGGPEFHNFDPQKSVTDTKDSRKSEMKVSVRGGGTPEIAGILNKLAETSATDNQLKGDVKDFLLQRGGAGTYIVKGEESTFVFKKFNDGSVFGQTLSSSLEEAEESLSSAHNLAGQDIAQKQKEVTIPTRVQARIDGAVKAAGGKTTQTVAPSQPSETLKASSASENANKPSRGLWATVWSLITTAANETVTFFEGIETLVAAHLSEAFSEVHASKGETQTDQATQPEKTPVRTTGHQPSDVQETKKAIDARVGNLKGRALNKRIETLAKQLKPERERLRNERRAITISNMKPEFRPLQYEYEQLKNQKLIDNLLGS